ncbi:MAG: DUF4065 domain-containing protein [Actinomycetota bacterium]|nr:DUF4065 domain-containing protein [Actinomycetota bacterium]
MNEKLECFECGHLVVPAIAEKLETLPVRGEPTEVLSRVGMCPECGSEMSVSELDEATLAAAFDAYRVKHGLMTPGEMQRLRERYGLGQRPFSLLLGWGEISLHRYEGGSLQDSAHNSQLKMVEDPANIRILLEANGHKLTARQRSVLELRLRALEQDRGSTYECRSPERFVAREDQDVYSGWRKLEVSKLREMMVYFCTLPHMFPTKLNKLLFYTDFGHYKEFAASVSGAPYLAFQYGPVPQHYEWIKADLLEGGDISAEEKYAADWQGDVLHAERAPDLSLFTPDELAIMRRVAEELAGLTSKQLSARSHSERAWIETQAHAMISYELARDLQF